MKRPGTNRRGLFGLFAGAAAMPFLPKPEYVTRSTFTHYPVSEFVQFGDWISFTGDAAKYTITGVR